MADTDNKESEDLISQDDIDQLLKGIEEIGDAHRDEESEPGGDLDVEDLVTQDEIDKLLGLTGDEGLLEEAPAEEEEEAELISQEDIDMLLKGMESADGQEMPSEEESLFESAPAEEIPLEEIPVDELPVDENPPEPAPEQPPPAEEPPARDEDLEMISMEDIQSIFQSEFQDVDGESAPPESEPAEGLISQDDIDSLLAGTDEPAAGDDLNDLLGEGGGEPFESPADEESLITQEDIDSLLNEAVADEVFSGEGQEGGSAELVSQDDIDRLLKGDMEEAPGETEAESPEAEQVILEDTEGEEIPEEGKKKGGKKWYKSVKIWAAASVVLLLSVSGALFFLLGGEEEPPFDMAVPAEQVGPGTEVAPEEPAFAYARGERMTSTLTGFIVPAPLKMKGVSFIAADISIEFVDVTADPLQGYEPFFRNLIYDVLKKALVMNDKSLIVEADLKRMIQEAVNDALTEGAVEKVDFIVFKIG